MALMDDFFDDRTDGSISWIEVGLCMVGDQVFIDLLGCVVCLAGWVMVG